MSQYVKFLRGTPAAYQALEPKDADTLYFIYEEDESRAALYLGSKEICGASGETSISLSDIKDVIISEAKDKQVLTYDQSQQKWVNANLEAFVGATGESNGKIGMVPAPQAGQNNLFLRGDGTWAEVNVTANGSNNIFTVVNSDKAQHTDLIAEATAEATLGKGDIFIIKDVIHGEKYQHTAYVYDGEKWVAMDGNYNAENVYFTSDFVFTEDVGAITVPGSGNITVPAAGKNLKEFFASVFAKEINPKITQPSATISLNPGTTAYEVGTAYTPHYTVNFNAGSYSYGPATGVTATYAVSDTNSHSSETQTGSFEQFTIGDDTNYKITATVTHTKGAVPKTNLGNNYEAGAIKAGTLSNVSTPVVKGFRNCFYGTLNEKTELTSDVIRSLKATGKAVAGGTALTISIPKGAMRIVVAYPATIKDIASVKDVNGMNAEIASSFVSSRVQVEGLNKYAAQEYKVFVLDYASAASETNTYKVTI